MRKQYVVPPLPRHSFFNSKDSCGQGIAGPRTDHSYQKNKESTSAFKFVGLRQDFVGERINQIQIYQVVSTSTGKPGSNLYIYFTLLNSCKIPFDWIHLEFPVVCGFSKYFPKTYLKGYFGSLVIYFTIVQ